MEANTHTPQPKGKRISVARVSLARPDAEGYMTIKVKVNDPPKLSASKKCYLYAFKQGESDIVVNCGDKDRKLRLTLILYAKVPAIERRAALELEARNSEFAGTPKLF